MFHSTLWLVIGRWIAGRDSINPSTDLKTFKVSFTESLSNISPPTSIWPSFLHAIQTPSIKMYIECADTIQLYSIWCLQSKIFLICINFVKLSLQNSWLISSYLFVSFRSSPCQGPNSKVYTVSFVKNIVTITYLTNACLLHLILDDPITILIRYS